MDRLTALLILSLLPGLWAGCTPYQTGGAPAGDIGSAVLDGKNPWHGGVIGGVTADIPGAAFADVSRKASREACMANKPVEYRTEDGRGVYRADPLGYDERTRCRKVHERIWEDIRLVKDRVKEVCEGERRRPPQ